jgi:serpin B
MERGNALVAEVVSWACLFAFRNWTKLPPRHINDCAMKLTLAFCLMLGLNNVLPGFSSMAHAEAPSSDTRQVVAGNTEFAVDLYGQLRTSEGNVFFSPYSISTALAMAYGGARGETEKQMARTLRFNLPPDKIHPAFAVLEANFRAVQQKGQVKLAVANSLWPQKGFAFLPDYFALCRKYYRSSIVPVDYREHTEAARKTINDWVEARTNRKIVELLKPGAVDGSTLLVLVNAIYFKGNWASPFETNLTTDQPFYVSPQKSVTAPLMRQFHDLRYAESPGLQVLELPYAGDDLSMIVLLPRTVDGLGHLETELTTQSLTSLTQNLPRQEVDVFLPKFKVTSEFSLAKTLAALEMSDAFTGQADFSGMDGRQDLFISGVIHQAFIEVNEQGTEAAAATAIMMAGSMAPLHPQPIPVFRADHPFLFLIRNNRDGSILFLGRVTDPTG